MIGIFTSLQVRAFVSGKLSTADISNCLLYGILACMCHSYCGGLVNVHVKKKYPSYRYKQKLNDEYLHIVLYYFQYTIYTRLYLVGKPYNLNVVASLMVLTQTVRPLLLLQGEGAQILVFPWHMTFDIYWWNPIKDDYVYQVRSLKFNGYSLYIYYTI